MPQNCECYSWITIDSAIFIFYIQISTNSKFNGDEIDLLIINQKKQKHNMKHDYHMN